MALIGLHCLCASLTPPPVSISLHSGIASQEPSLRHLHAKLRVLMSLFPGGPHL